MICGALACLLSVELILQIIYNVVLLFACSVGFLCCIEWSGVWCCFYYVGFCFAMLHVLLF